MLTTLKYTEFTYSWSTVYFRSIGHKVVDLHQLCIWHLAEQGKRNTEYNSNMNLNVNVNAICEGSPRLKVRRGCMVNPVCHAHQLHTFQGFLITLAALPQRTCSLLSKPCPRYDSSGPNLGHHGQDRGMRLLVLLKPYYWYNPQSSSFNMISHVRTP